MHVFFLGLTTNFYSSVCYCRFLCFITARKRSLGQGNIFSNVCQEFCSQEGGSASVHAGIPPPPRSRHPPDQAHLRSRHPAGSSHTPPESRHPPEQTPPCAVHAGRYGQQAGGMHPTGMQSCI